MLTIWQACATRSAGACERARLPFGSRVRSALRVHVSGCAYKLAGVCAALCGGALTVWQACAQRSAGARERVCLPFGRRARSADAYLAVFCESDAKNFAMCSAPGTRTC